MTRSYSADAGLDAALERLCARLRLQSISTEPVFAASAAFMTSVSSPVNTLVVVPGNYVLGDFVRAGLPFSLIVPGRTTCAMVRVLLGEAEAGLEVKKADGLRRAVVAAVAERHTPVIVDIVFTVIEEFAAPPRASSSTPLSTRPAASPPLDQPHALQYRAGDGHPGNR